MTDRIKVVVIDDEEDLCYLVKDNLEEKGSYEVTVVTDPMTVEKVCSDVRPNLILLDVVMPKRKGSEIAKALKDSESTRDIPIIIMSGLGEMVYFKRTDQWKWIPNQPGDENKEVLNEGDPRKAAAAYGVDDYIAKPFSTEVLIELIEQVLKKKARESK